MGIVDAQGVKNTESARQKGYDGGKKISGIKRHLIVDTNGLPHAISITTANVTDREGAIVAIEENKKHLKKDEYYTRIHFFALIFFLVSLTIFSFFIYINEKRYLLMITPFIYLYASYSIIYLALKINKKFQIPKLSFIYLLIPVIIIDTITTQNLIFIPKKYYQMEHYTPQPNFNAIYSHIKNQSPFDEYILISAYPYMDKIYLGKKNYAVPISYTGRDVDLNISNSVEYYSGTQALYEYGEVRTLENFKKINFEKNIYVILDNMAKSRTDDDFIEYIEEVADTIITFENEGGDSIYLYEIPKI